MRSHNRQKQSIAAPKPKQSTGPSSVQFSAAKLASLLSNNNHAGVQTVPQTNVLASQPIHTQTTQSSSHRSHTNQPPPYDHHQISHTINPAVNNKNHNTSSSIFKHTSDHVIPQTHSNHSIDYGADVVSIYRLNSPLNTPIANSHTLQTITHSTHVAAQYSNNSLPSTAHIRPVSDTAILCAPIHHSFRSDYMDDNAQAAKLRKQQELRDALAQQVAEKQLLKQKQKFDNDDVGQCIQSPTINTAYSNYNSPTQRVLSSTNTQHNQSPSKPQNNLSPSTQPKLSENRSRQMSSSIFGGTSTDDIAAHKRALAQAELRAQIDEQKRQKQLLKQQELEDERRENEKIERDRILLANKYNQPYIPSNDIINTSHKQHDVNHDSSIPVDSTSSNVYPSLDTTNDPSESIDPADQYVDPHQQCTDDSIQQPSNSHQFQFNHQPPYTAYDNRPNTSLLKQQFEQYQHQLGEYDQYNDYQQSYQHNQYQSDNHVIPTDVYSHLKLRPTDYTEFNHEYAYDDINSATLQRQSKPINNTIRRSTLQPRKAKPIPLTAAEQRAIDIAKRKAKGMCTFIIY